MMFEHNYKNLKMSSWMQKKTIPDIKNLNIALILVILCVVGITLHLNSIYKNSFIGSDTAQYLSVAKNLFSGEGFSTSIIYYNENKLSGRVPAPQTVFPNGYPFLINLVMQLGFSPSYSAFLICMLCFNLIGIELYIIAKKLNYSKIIVIVIILFWFFLVYNWLAVLSCISEMCFIFFTTTSAYFILKSETTKKKYYVLLSSIAAALSFTMRYAGIFFILSIILYFTWELIKYKKRDSIIDLLLISFIPIITVGLTVIRNYSITGGFRGSSRYLPEGTIKKLFYKIYSSFCTLSGFSKKALYAYDIPSILMAITGGILLVFLVRYIMISHKLEYYQQRDDSIRLNNLSAFYLTLSLLFLAYFDLAAIEPFHHRYLIPLIPFMAIIVSNKLQRLINSYSIDSKIFYAWFCILLVSFLSGQTKLYEVRINKHLKNNYYDKVNVALNEAIEPINLKKFLQKEITNKNPLLSNSSLVETILEVPVIGLSIKSYQKHNWPVSEVKKTIKKYEIAYIIFFRNIYDIKSIKSKELIFYRDLYNKKIPIWLNVIYFDDNVSLFKVDAESFF